MQRLWPATLNSPDTADSHTQRSVGPTLPLTPVIKSVFLWLLITTVCDSQHNNVLLCSACPTESFVISTCEERSNGNIMKVWLVCYVGNITWFDPLTCTFFNLTFVDRFFFFKIFPPKIHHWVNFSKKWFICFIFPNVGNIKHKGNNTSSQIFYNGLLKMFNFYFDRNTSRQETTLGDLTLITYIRTAGSPLLMFAWSNFRDLISLSRTMNTNGLCNVIIDYILTSDIHVQMFCKYKE